jgi:hypothetical protein
MTLTFLPKFTLSLQKSRMLQVQGIKAAAVVVYRKALIRLRRASARQATREMRYHRLSRRVNNTVKKNLSLEITGRYILIKA